MDFSFHDIRLESPRLTLRTLTPEDASQTYADWLNDPEVNRYLETKSGTLESVRAYIETKRKQADALFFGMFIGGEHMIGTIKLEPIDTASKTATIAIMIGESSARGKGLGPEAIRALVRYGFDHLGLREINLGVIEDNVGAIRAYEKVGFSEIVEGVHSRPGHITMSVTPGTFRAQDTPVALSFV